MQRSMLAARGAVLKVVLLVLLVFVIALGVLYRFYVAPQVGDFRVILNAMLGTGIDTPGESTLQQQLKIADDVEFSLFAGDLPNARWLRITPDGDLLVSRPRKGDIVLLERDRDGDGRADGRQTLLSGLNMPHGLELIGEWLYLAEQNAIGRVRFDGRAVTGEFERVLTGLPGGGNHWAKNIALGPDGWLYFNVGSSCNVCIEEDRRRGTLMRVRPDGSEAQIHATGLRNATGFDWAPWNQTLYAGDISRDLLGDDYPVDELNRIEHGAFYGWPYVNDFGDADPDLGSRLPQGLEAVDPIFGIDPHTTPLGLHFLRHPQLTRQYGRAALLALHGSWNRSVPDGYKLLLLRWGEDGAITSRELVSGFWTGSNILGRPVDVEVDSNANVYLSDDYAGAVYRLRLNGQK